MSDFDEVLRQSEQWRRTNRAQEEHQVRQRRAKASSEDEFRASLRQFGQWCAREATARGLPSEPLLAREMVTPPTSLVDRLRRRGPAGPEPQIEAVDSGWEVLPLHPRDGLPRTGRSHEWGGVWRYGELMNPETIYECLTVNEQGDVRVGVSTKEGIFISGINTGIHTGLVGAGPDTLTCSDVLYLADLNAGITSLYTPEDFARADEAAATNRETERQLVALYVAGAKVMFDRA